MKQRVLITILAFILAFAARAQDGGEVEFMVKKQVPQNECFYYYKYRSGFDYAYICIRKIEDTLFYYYSKAYNDTTFIPDKESANYVLASDTQFLPLKKITFTRTKDTVFATIDVFNFDARYKYPIYSKTELTHGLDLNDLITGQFPHNINRTSIVSKHVVVAINDTVYTCIKLKTSNGISLSKLTDGVWSKPKHLTKVEYCYLRKSDLLPVKIESAEPVKRFSPQKEYPVVNIECELYKAIE